jgi:hypothetical protein
MRQHQRHSRAFAIASGSSLIVLTAICAALLSAEPPLGRHALRHFESQVVKAKTILHHLSAAAPTQDSVRIRLLVEGLLELQPPAASEASAIVPPMSDDPRVRQRPNPVHFERPPPALPA